MRFGHTAADRFVARETEDRFRGRVELQHDAAPVHHNDGIDRCGDDRLEPRRCQPVLDGLLAAALIEALQHDGERQKRHDQKPRQGRDVPQRPRHFAALAVRFRREVVNSDQGHAAHCAAQIGGLLRK